MYLDTPPRLIGTTVFSAMPEAFRRKGVRTDWADANRAGQPADCFIEGSVLRCRQPSLYRGHSVRTHLSDRA
jgi:hypothetical protein